MAGTRAPYPWFKQDDLNGDLSRIIKSAEKPEEEIISEQTDEIAITEITYSGVLKRQCGNCDKCKCDKGEANWGL